MKSAIVLITGMSGSGKSVALNALEDAGYYCVDNLPPELLTSFVALERQHDAQRVAIAMDVRSATSLPLVPQQLRQLRAQGVAVQSLFLDANTETLVRRFSETRRLHPLSRTDASDQHRALVERGADRAVQPVLEVHHALVLHHVREQVPEERRVVRQQAVEIQGSLGGHELVEPDLPGRYLGPLLGRHEAMVRIGTPLAHGFEDHSSQCRSRLRSS